MAKYFVGIDLGTTNIVLAYAPIDNYANTELFKIPQLIAPSQVRRLSLLPSVRYFEKDALVNPSLYDLPWGSSPIIIGQMAKEKSLSTTNATINSVKSWLSHPVLDITQEILPLSVIDEDYKASPLAVIKEFLEYLIKAWDHDYPNDRLLKQNVVITIPASFDERARLHILAAANDAGGFKHIELLEEPQAAFYNWLADHDEAKQIKSEHELRSLALVCDVGGGTTDFTLILLTINKNGPNFERVAVGKHLLLGGDNMDMVLAYSLQQKEKLQLSPTEIAQWMQQARNAKETLLLKPELADVTVTLLGRGKSLFNRQKTAKLTRANIDELIIESFFPMVDINTKTAKYNSGIRKIGLPYEKDSAITKHLAEFLTHSAAVIKDGLNISQSSKTPIPEVVLFNGGVFYSKQIQTKIISQLEIWSGITIEALELSSPSLAVAKGAVYYQKNKHEDSKAIVKSALSASYFLLLEEQSKQAVCILAKGAEEGIVFEIERSFNLRIGEPVLFPLYFSRELINISAGDILTIDESFIELPSLMVCVTTKNKLQQENIQVKLNASYNSIGIIEVTCIDENLEKYSLSLNVSAKHQNKKISYKTDISNTKNDIINLNDLFLSYFVAKKNISGHLFKTKLDNLIGKKLLSWDISFARAVFDKLFVLKAKRRRNEDIECRWWNLAGILLRPGNGSSKDAYRCDQLWQLYKDGLQYSDKSQNWAEWWACWRRVSSGLNAQAQTDLYNNIKSVLFSRKDQLSQRSIVGFDEKLRLIAVLEKISLAKRVQIVNLLMSRLKKNINNTLFWWMLARVGNREFFSDALEVIPEEALGKSLISLFGFKPEKKVKAIIVKSLCLLARKVENSENNLSDSLFNNVVSYIQALGSYKKEISLIKGEAELDSEFIQFVHGEQLPLGLRMLDYNYG